MSGSQVLSAVCVGVVGYFGNRYYYDVGTQTAEWMLLVLKKVLKLEQLDVWKPVMFFLTVASACLLNTLCLLVACTISHNTASAIAKTVYVRKHSPTSTPAISIQDCPKLVNNIQVLPLASKHSLNIPKFIFSK
jgi:hypothetical protein